MADEAGVSESTLYNNYILKEHILSLRAIEKGAPNESIVAMPKDKIKTKDDKIINYMKKLRNLKKIRKS